MTKAKRKRDTVLRRRYFALDDQFIVWARVAAETRSLRKRRRETNTIPKKICFGKDFLERGGIGVVSAVFARGADTRQMRHIPTKERADLRSFSTTKPIVWVIVAAETRSLRKRRRELTKT